MAKRERNKRAARKARQQERERVAVAQATASAGNNNSKAISKSSSKAPAKSSKKAAVAKADRKGMQKVSGYFADVRSEMRQVTWPSKLELRNYTVAVIAFLVFFGLIVWLIDTGFIAGLVQFTGLRG